MTNRIIQKLTLNHRFLYILPKVTLAPPILHIVRISHLHHHPLHTAPKPPFRHPLHIVRMPPPTFLPCLAFSPLFRSLPLPFPRSPSFSPLARPLPTAPKPPFRRPLHTAPKPPLHHRFCILYECHPCTTLCTLYECHPCTTVFTYCTNVTPSPPPFAHCAKATLAPPFACCAKATLAPPILHIVRMAPFRHRICILYECHPHLTFSLAVFLSPSLAYFIHTPSPFSSLPFLFTHLFALARLFHPVPPSCTSYKT